MIIISEVMILVGVEREILSWTESDVENDWQGSVQNYLETGSPSAIRLSSR